MKSFKDIASGIKWSEHKVMRGFQNPDKQFYVIRRRSKEVGLFSYVLTALGHMVYAESKGYYPVVDMKNYESPYLDKVSKQNVWEYYFRQPTSYNLEDIKYSKNIILSSGESPQLYPDFAMFNNEKEIQYWREKFHKYIQLNEYTKKYIENEEKILFPSERILGVICRGTDYRDMRPHNHPVQPNIEDVISLSERVMVNKKYSKIYLSTEDKYILNKFKNKFGDKLLFVNMEMRPYCKGNYITETQLDRKDDKKLKGLEYLTQIALLSKCDGFIGSGCGGSYGALLMSNGYEWEFRWNLGVYK